MERRPIDVNGLGRYAVAIDGHKYIPWVSLAEVPTAEKVGRWEESDIPCEKFRCSVCGGACWYYDYQGDVAKSRFCPNCGARMEDVFT